MKLSFSVVIPTLNEELYLPKVLGDLEAQTSKDFEVIVVDGNSTDNTRTIAQAFSKKMPLTFLTCTKRNVSCQRNMGAEMAKGKYLVFLDADNRIPKDFIVALKQPCLTKGYPLIIPTILPEDTSQKTKVLISLVNTLVKLSQTYGRPLSGGGNFIIKKDLFEKLGGFQEDLFMSEDHDLVRRAWQKGYKAKVLRTVKVTNSMRRGDVEGDMSLIYKYVVGFLAYTIVPTDRGLKTKLFEYEMGGHRYDTQLQVKSEKLKGKKKRIDMDRVKQFLQMSVLVEKLRDIGL